MHSNSILSMASSMTDEERDQIDKDVQDFVKLGNDVIKILKVESNYLILNCLN